MAEGQSKEGPGAEEQEGASGRRREVPVRLLDGLLAAYGAVAAIPHQSLRATLAVIQQLATHVASALLAACQQGGADGERASRPMYCQHQLRSCCKMRGQNSRRKPHTGQPWAGLTLQMWRFSCCRHPCRVPPLPLLRGYS